MSSSSKLAGDVKQAVETFSELCTHVEHALGIKIPTYLKNILLHSGFDNRVTLRSLGESDISSLETFVRSDIYHDRSKYSGSREASDFYSDACQFHRNNFIIPPGHRRLLISIAAYLQLPSNSKTY